MRRPSGSLRRAGCGALGTAAFLQRRELGGGVTLTRIGLAGTGLGTRPIAFGACRGGSGSVCGRRGRHTCHRTGLPGTQTVQLPHNGVTHTVDRRDIVDRGGREESVGLPLDPGLGEECGPLRILDIGRLDALPRRPEEHVWW